MGDVDLWAGCLGRHTASGSESDSRQSLQETASCQQQNPHTLSEVDTKRRQLFSPFVWLFITILT